MFDYQYCFFVTLDNVLLWITKFITTCDNFSEDIDLAIDRDMFGLQGDLTTKQVKKLRKESSLFVKGTFFQSLQDLVNQYGLQDYWEIEPEPDGQGDKTYPEPRKIFIRYESLFDSIPYIKSEIILEVGSRSLIEPTKTREVRSMISEALPIETSPVNPLINTAVADKTFIEKIFLLHELFSTSYNGFADRKSRHLYDIEKMMDLDFAQSAIVDNDLWEAIRHHREVFTRIKGVDYSQDIRKNISLIPPSQAIDDWREDYEAMQSTMIYGSSLSFDELINRIKQLSERMI